MFYRNIASFKFQPYLEYFTVHKFCQALTRLRVSSHRLHIEAGRWAKPISIPLNERKCSICQQLEDEYHFVLECSIYNDLRKKYIPKKYWLRPNMYKFVELLSSTNKCLVRKLGNFVDNAFKVRNMIVYS